MYPGAVEFRVCKAPRRVYTMDDALPPQEGPRSLTDHPLELLRMIYTALAEPLDPVPACHFASTCRRCLAFPPPLHHCPSPRPRPWTPQWPAHSHAAPAPRRVRCLLLHFLMPALLSPCSAVRDAVRSRCAPGALTESEELRHWHKAARGLCDASQVPLTLARLRVATSFELKFCGSIDPLVLAHLMACGSIGRLK